MLFDAITHTGHVKIHPSELDANVHDVVTRRIAEQFEGVCSPAGFVHPGSVCVTAVHDGAVEMEGLSGYTLFPATFSATACVLKAGDVFVGRVTGTNKFGILVEAGRGAVVAIVPREAATFASDAPIDAIAVGQDVTLEVVLSKYVPHKSWVSVIGRVVAEGSNPVASDPDDPCDTDVDEGVDVDDAMSVGGSASGDSDDRSQGSSVATSHVDDDDDADADADDCDADADADDDCDVGSMLDCDDCDDDPDDPDERCCPPAGKQSHDVESDDDS